MRLRRCIPCLLFLAALACFAYTAHAQTPGIGPLSRITSDGLFGLVGSAMFLLLAGYEKGIERRITGVEHEQKQLQQQFNLFREVTHEKHPSRVEFTEFRVDMRDRFDRLEQLMRDHRP